MEKENHDYVGHRQRLRERFLRSLGSDMADYEALEMLLTYALPRKDVKPLAKVLIRKFGSFAKVVSAPISKLTDVKGIKDNTAILIKFIEFAAQKLSWQNLAFDDTPIIATIIYVDAKLRVIGNEILQRGSVSSVCIHHRDVVAKALSNNAVGVIMVHNHPSGDSRPSTNDIEVTKRVRKACEAADIMLHEHIIITPSNYFSFAEHGLISDF